ncbi:hypothetical protein [Variovorax sp. CY25R-8]|uniref:hypothetical protein n=1 Tax=Variovorax sp. CY25R-8 TaxID=2855501 RepID=UPI0021BB7E24|nr:hypothetical protein [Variovorax sp. CY25R-8]MCT8174367.1 hypothetical protein [Variovorax sp. CY25R-8]
MWSSTAAEYGLLVAWQLGQVMAAGRLLTAWIVLGGLFGIAMVLGPPNNVLPAGPRVYGERAAMLFDLAMVAALFALGHSLLGVLWFFAFCGVLSHSYRAARRRQGGANG